MPGLKKFKCLKVSGSVCNNLIFLEQSFIHGSESSELDGFGLKIFDHFTALSKLLEMVSKTYTFDQV